MRKKALVLLLIINILACPLFCKTGACGCANELCADELCADELCALESMNQGMFGKKENCDDVCCDVQHPRPSSSNPEDINDRIAQDASCNQTIGHRFSSSCESNRVENGHCGRVDCRSVECQSQKGPCDQGNDQQRHCDFCQCICGGAIVLETSYCLASHNSAVLGYTFSANQSSVELWYQKLSQTRWRSDEQTKSGRVLCVWYESFLL